MATVNISELYGKTIEWNATLSNSFNTNYYQGVGITTTSFTDGVTSISGSIVYHAANSSRTSTTTPLYSDTLSVSSGQTTLYFYSKSKSGQYWNIESKTHSFTSAYITIVSVGSDSVTFRISYDSAMRYKRFLYKKGTSGTVKYLPSSTTWNSSTSSYTETITGLEPNTTYYYNGIVSRSSTQSNANSINIYESNTESFTTTSAPSISSWSWTSTNSTVNPAHTHEASLSQTTAARNACRDKTAVSNFSYKVWNDLVWKVSEARVAGGKSEWNNNYASRANTLMSSSDRTLTATRYNSLRYNIGSVYEVPTSRKIDEVDVGDEVGGTTHFLNFVTYYLNAYIDTL